MSKKVAIYLRKSRSDEGLDALRNHKAVLTRLAESRGFEYDIYEEIGSSISLEIREELNKLLDNLDKYSHVLVMDLDRLARSIAVMEEIKKKLQYHDVKILTPNQEIDLNNESQEMVMDFQSVIAKAEYQQIRKRMQIGKIEGARQGYWVNGVAPLGYSYDRNIRKLVINEKEYPLVKEIFNMALRNMSFHEIAVNLNVKGYRTRNGNLFTPASIKTILTNRAYVGDVVYRKKSKVKGGQDTVIVSHNCHPAIISDADWLEVQRLIQSRRTNIGKTTPKVRSMVQGLVYCGCCGAKLGINAPSSKDKDRAGELYIKGCWKVNGYGERCPNKSIKVVEIEKDVIKAIQVYRDMVEKRIIKLMSQDTSSIEAEIKEKMKNIKAEIKKQEEQLKRLLDAYLDAIIDKDTYSAKKKEKEESIQTLNNDLKILEIRLSSLDTGKYIQKLKQILFTLDNFKIFDVKGANMVLQTIVKRITYKRVPDENSWQRRAKTKPEIVIEFMDIEEI